MTDDSISQIRLDQIAEDFLARRRKGETPSVAEYQKQHPELTDEIQELIATLAVVAEFEIADGDTVKNHLDDSVTDQPAPEEIGPYKIVSELGQGGMGAVYRARQSEPIKREVALKVIRGGSGSKKILERFNAERQAVALMDHPNIAKVLDAGASKTGSPFFVMELVEGKPITEYCDEQKLGIPQRLQLFTQVCNAVQHAHQKGIIHRDLKPGNILVGTYDGIATPKVIDFGLAKALDQQQIHDKSRLTQYGNIVGTLRYMSPEQAGQDSLDVDTRTDIYSLGVVLYELLTGTTPVENETETSRPILKVLEMVLNQDPQRPSDRLSSSGDSISSITDQRKTNPSKLQSILRGELDWVVMKALEKDRDRRYKSAAAFASDIQSYLSGDVVQARPPSTGYKVKKFVGKNRGLVAAAGSVVGLLVAGVAGTSYGLVQANNSAQQERIAKQDALDEKELADASAKRAKDVLSVVTKSFASASPAGGGIADMSAKEILFRAKDILAESKLDPLGTADVLSSLNVCFRGVGEFDAAIAVAQQELGLRENEADDAQRIAAAVRLGSSQRQAGKLVTALKRLEEVHAEAVEKLPATDSVRVNATYALAQALSDSDKQERAIELHQEVYDIELSLNPHSLATYSSANALASSYHLAGRDKKALELFEEAYEGIRIDLGEEDVHTLNILNNLAEVYEAVNQVDKAIDANERVLEMRKVKLGEDHPNTITSMNNLAFAYQSADRLPEAIELFEKTLESSQKKLGDKHPKTMTLVNNLAMTYWRDKQLDKSIPMFEQVVSHLEATYGRDHTYTQSTLANLGVNYRDDEQYDLAIEYLREVHENSFENPQLEWTTEALRGVYTNSGQLEPFRAIMKEELKRTNSKYSDDSAVSLEVHSSICRDLVKLELYDEAESMIKETLANGKSLGEEHWHNCHASHLLGSIRLANDESALAEPLLKQGYLGMKAQAKDIPSYNRRTFLAGGAKKLIEWAKAIESEQEIQKWEKELKDLNPPSD